MSILKQIATPAPTACGIRVGTTVRAVGQGGKDLTGVLTRIRDEDGERQIRINAGPLGFGNTYNTVFTEGKVTLTPVCTPADGALLVIDASTDNVVGICYDQQGAHDWIMGNADVDDYAVASF